MPSSCERGYECFLGFPSICPVGKFSPSENSTCEVCAENFYSYENGTFECSKCENGAKGSWTTEKYYH